MTRMAWMATEWNLASTRLAALDVIAWCNPKTDPKEYGSKTFKESRKNLPAQSNTPRAPTTLRTPTNKPNLKESRSNMSKNSTLKAGNRLPEGAAGETEECVPLLQD